MLNKVEFILDEQIITWRPGDPSFRLTVNEKQFISLIVYTNKEIIQYDGPKLDLEDYSVPLHQIENSIADDLLIYKSIKERFFRESFGSAVLRMYIADTEYLFHFEVLATKMTAVQAEKMISYLSSRREDIIRICLSRTKRISGISESGTCDPEIILSTAETIINIISENRSEFKQKIKSKLVSQKAPAWSTNSSTALIDPVDIIFNLDSLRPGDGRQDVTLRGRTYSTSAIDVTTLKPDTNIFENHVLIGGLYSILRVVSSLMLDITDNFKKQTISSYDKEYISLGEILIKFTGGAMYFRCEKIISAAESLIKMFEKDFNITFKGEVQPRITPFVKSTRTYRVIFEQYSTWYGLGKPTLDGYHFLIKLRSISKIFEFFVLFKIIDFFIHLGLEIQEYYLNKDFDNLIPSKIVFENLDYDIEINYEMKIFKYSNFTNNDDLVRINSKNSYWCPDFVLKYKDKNISESRFLILDAKYSSAYNVKNFLLQNIRFKYYDNTAVFNSKKFILSRDKILGVFAIYPDNKFYNNFIGNNQPQEIPIFKELPISFEDNDFINSWLNSLLKITLKSID